MRVVLKTGALLAYLFLCGCESETLLVPDTVNPEPEVYASYSAGVHHISSQQAVNSFLNFWNDGDNQSAINSRSANNIEIIGLTPYDIISRGESNEFAELECDTLLYIANFDNGDGYAILPADDRISVPVLAVTHEGRLSESTINSYIRSKTLTRVNYPDFPNSGPGLFTIPETEDEIYLNPNTLNPIIPGSTDSIIGYYDYPDELYSLDYQNDNSSYSGYLELLSLTFCADYAYAKVRGVDFPDDGFRTEDTTDNPAVSWGSGGPSFPTEPIYEPWEETTTTPNLLKQFYWLTQSEPYGFNEYFPYRRKYIAFGNKRKAPMGCMTLAIAKTMMFLQKPEVYYGFSTFPITWTALSAGLNSSVFANNMKFLSWSISEGCGCWYFWGGTFTIPDNARKFMRNNGYEHVQSNRYNTDEIIDMLDKNRPVIIYAIPNINIFKAHAWNIDGYKIKERLVHSPLYHNGIFLRMETKKETLTMVHCDFGHGGNCNGYYASGVFNQKGSDVEFDNTSNGGKANYNTHVRTIIYSVE